jgi:hypothetical protein
LTGWYVTIIFGLPIVSIVEPICPFIAFLKLGSLAKDSSGIVLFASESAVLFPL